MTEKCELCNDNSRLLVDFEGLIICRACRQEIEPYQYQRPVRYHNPSRTPIHMNGCMAAPVPKLY